jgi:hypothetical protein
LALKSEPGEVSEETRYGALRQASSVIASLAGLNGVLENLARLLASVVKFEFPGVVLHDAPLIYRAMRRRFPYLKSRLIPGEFHPIISYLFTE